MKRVHLWQQGVKKVQFFYHYEYIYYHSQKSLHESDITKACMALSPCKKNTYLITVNAMQCSIVVYLYTVNTSIKSKPITRLYASLYVVRSPFH